jgi:hypothetical protein
MGLGVIHLAWEHTVAYSAAIVVKDIRTLPCFGEFLNEQHAHDRAHDTHTQELCGFPCLGPLILSRISLCFEGLMPVTIIGPRITDLNAGA